MSRRDRPRRPQPFLELTQQSGCSEIRTRTTSPGICESYGVLGLEKTGRVEVNLGGLGGR